LLENLQVDKHFSIKGAKDDENGMFIENQKILQSKKREKKPQREERVNYWIEIKIIVCW